MAVHMSIMNLRPKRELFEEIAQIMGIKLAFVEKDWYVVQLIGIIAGIQHDDFGVIFSGGTALSKAHKLLRRFSEDVDFRVLEQKDRSTRNSRSAFRREVVNALRHRGFTIEEQQVKARDENRFFSIDIYYESYFPPADALRPHILIELTVKNIQLPPHYLSVSSFVNEVAKHSPEVAHIGCIDPAESAADKLSAIAWRIPDRIRGGQDDDPYLVRHIHDLAILKDTALQRGDFSELVATSMQQDSARPRNDVSISSLTAPDKFQRMMDALQSDIEYAQEYKRFVNGVSYAAPEQTPDFTSAVEALRKMVEALRLGKKI
jgi:Nucleotidyl transferase AbiEii toxin, Type IV TA system